MLLVVYLLLLLPLASFSYHFISPFAYNCLQISLLTILLEEVLSYNSPVRKSAFPVLRSFLIEPPSLQHWIKYRDSDFRKISLPLSFLISESTAVFLFFSSRAKTIDYRYKGPGFSHGTEPGGLELILDEVLVQCNRKDISREKIFESCRTP